MPIKTNERKESKVEPTLTEISQVELVLKKILSYITYNDLIELEGAYKEQDDQSKYDIEDRLTEVEKRIWEMTQDRLRLTAHIQIDLTNREQTKYWEWSNELTTRTYIHETLRNNVTKVTLISQNHNEVPPQMDFNLANLFSLKTIRLDGISLDKISLRAKARNEISSLTVLNLLTPTLNNEASRILKSFTNLRHLTKDCLPDHTMDDIKQMTDQLEFLEIEITRNHPRNVTSFIKAHSRSLKTLALVAQATKIFTFFDMIGMQETVFENVSNIRFRDYSQTKPMHQFRNEMMIRKNSFSKLNHITVGTDPVLSNTVTFPSNWIHPNIKNIVIRPSKRHYNFAKIPKNRINEIEQYGGNTYRYLILDIPLEIDIDEHTWVENNAKNN